MTDTPCPFCRKPKARGKYLCWDCWDALPQPARRALSRRDTQAVPRLRELHAQIAAGVPLAEIRVAP
jgi:hypothetical protein